MYLHAWNMNNTVLFIAIITPSYFLRFRFCQHEWFVYICIRLLLTKLLYDKIIYHNNIFATASKLVRLINNK